MGAESNRPGRRRAPFFLRMAPAGAAAWAAVYGGLAASSVIAGEPHPWVRSVVATEAGEPLVWTTLGRMSPSTVGWLLGCLAFAVGIALAISARGPHRARRFGGWTLVTLGLVVAIVVADVRALSFLGYLPMIALALLGVGPLAGHLDLDIVVASALALTHSVGGLAILASGVGMLDRAVRRERGTGLRWPAWAPWGRRAVLIAVIVPLMYAVTRVAWALGIPLGVRQEMLDELGSARWAGLGLALFGILGAWLTTGLISRWGEEFWAWVPRLGGRRVPISLAVVPALFVAVTVAAAGVSFWVQLLSGHLDELPGTTADWAAWVPELFWPLWGAALAVAALGYVGRRTGDGDRPADLAPDRLYGELR